MHFVILLWFSLDVIKLWMTTKDGLYLVDSHQLPLRPCVVCHYFFKTFFFFFNGDKWRDPEVHPSCRFIFRGKCHVAQSGWSRRSSDQVCRL